MDRVAALYRKHSKLIWRVLWRARVPKADIDDLIHEVFLVILRKLPTYTPPSPRPGQTPEDQEIAWMCKITFYEAMNYRARQRHRQVEPMDDNHEVPDARDETARLHDREQLLVLLYSTTPERRAIFELVELEGFSVVQAAGILEITETNATRRLGLARQDIEKAVKALAQRDRDAGKKEQSAFLLPFGVGAWQALRDLQNPPEGRLDEIWKRVQTTMETIDAENDRPANPPPQPAPSGQLLQTIGALLNKGIGYVLAGCIGGALVALLVLRPPETRIAILRLPVPFVVASSAIPAPVGTSTAATENEPMSPRAVPGAATKVDPAEARLLRKAQAAYAAGDRRTALEALNAYDAQFPAGRLKDDARALRAALSKAGVK
jgi:RNA polymerase sigma-70 factor (ECF subfamily)